MRTENVSLILVKGQINNQAFCPFQIKIYNEY